MAANENRPSKLKLKDRPTIRLDENPSTGYVWEFELPDGVDVERDEFVGGQRLVHFKFTAPGRHRVICRYLRVFDRNDIAREIVLKYHVKDGKNGNGRDFH